MVLDPTDLGVTIVVAPGQCFAVFYLPPTQITCLLSKASTVIKSLMGAVIKDKRWHCKPCLESTKHA
jgi:hypothetical protein